MIFFVGNRYVGGKFEGRKLFSENMLSTIINIQSPREVIFYLPVDFVRFLSIRYFFTGYNRMCCVLAGFIVDKQEISFAGFDIIL